MKTQGNETEQLDYLWSLIQEGRHCIAFTGAGVSTLSGIRDFRGKNGLYKDVDADKIFDLQVFKRNPEIYYSMTRDFIYNLEEKKPSLVHTVLASLESRGLLKALVTQNIDLLHEKAGSKRVLEIHGSPSVHYCPQALDHDTMSFEEAAELVRNGKIPRCSVCSSVLKPAITFFGEALPQQAILEAQKEAATTDLMLVLGSSLLVYPAAGLPQTALRHGAKLIIVNDSETHLDNDAELVFRDLETVFAYLKDRLAATDNGRHSANTEKEPLS